MEQGGGACGFEAADVKMTIRERAHTSIEVIAYGIVVEHYHCPSVVIKLLRTGGG